MQFFETYFTKHHFVHTPHKWFAALLLSPIHASEVHYKQRYHLTFAHAKKLFALDMALLASIVVLIGVTIFWFTYDPSVTDLVRLSFTSSEERIKSGDYVSWTLTYKNTSDVTLESPSISFRLPPGFVPDTDKTKTLDPARPVISLPPVEPKQEGTQVVSGWFYGTPGEEISTVADFSYSQPTRTIRESKTVRLLSTLRGSVVETDIQAPQTLLQTGSTLITIILTNTSDHTLPPLSIPLSQSETGFHLEQVSSSEGIITIAPKQTITLQAHLISELPPNLAQATYSFTPSFLVNGAVIPQLPVSTSFVVVHPSVDGVAHWTEAFGKPNNNSTLTFTLTNKGNVDLKNVVVSIDLPIAVVDMATFRAKNGARIDGNMALFTSQSNPTLATLKAGQSISFPVVIPVKSSPQGTDITLDLNTSITAEVQDIPSGRYQTTVDPEALPVGTNIHMNTELRYFTDEGDQLGRGPLPPVVGKETKYWALIQITNASSDIQDVQFRATLPSYVSWTGRTSVSHGKDITFDTKNRTVLWSANQVAAHTAVGLYIELALTPEAGMAGTSPTLLKDMTVVGKDAFIHQSVTASSRALDISIPTDEIGRQRGTTVVTE